MLYNSLFRSHLEFGIIAYSSALCSKLRPIVNLQKKCIRNIKNANYRAHTDPIFKSLQILKFEDLCFINRAKFMHSYFNDRTPESFSGMFTLLRDAGIRFTRNKENFDNYIVDKCKNEFLERMPKASLPKAWNNLPAYIKNTESKDSFGDKLDFLCLDQYPNLVDCDDLACPSCFPNQLWFKSGLNAIKDPFFL